MTRQPDEEVCFCAAGEVAQDALFANRFDQRHIRLVVPARGGLVEEQFAVGLALQMVSKGLDVVLQVVILAGHADTHVHIRTGQIEARVL